MNKCEDCNVKLFTGWVENPVYRNIDDDRDEIVMIEMNITYCPKCDKVTSSNVVPKAESVEHETFLMLDSRG